MKKILTSLALVSLALGVAAPVLAADTASVTATVTPQLVAVSISDGTVAYGTLAAGASQDTVTLVDTQVVSNGGNVNEDFNIRGQNSANWTLAASAGDEQYKHEFSTNGAFPGTALTISNQVLSAGVGSGGTANLDLKITTPTSTTATDPQSVSVTVQASAS